jgi:hypothetical protein
MVSNAAKRAAIRAVLTGSPGIRAAHGKLSGSGFGDQRSAGRAIFMSSFASICVVRCASTGSGVNGWSRSAEFSAANASLSASALRRKYSRVSLKSRMSGNS